MPDLADDPAYRAGYRQGLADGGFSFTEPVEVHPKRRYIFAAITFAAGVGGALATIGLASPKYRAISAIALFSGAVLGAAMGAAHILVDDNPTTPNLRLRI